MITSAKKYSKEKKKDRQNPKTHGKSKAMQTKSHKEAYRYTLTKTVKGNIYIYVFKKKEESNQINKQITNLLMIISSKY